MAVPAYDGKRQLMVPGGRFMAENDKSCEMVGWQTVFFCSVLSPQHSVLFVPTSALRLFFFVF